MKHFETFDFINQTHDMGSVCVKGDRKCSIIVQIPPGKAAFTKEGRTVISNLWGVIKQDIANIGTKTFIQ